MVTGNRLMVVCMTFVALACVAAATVLAWRGETAVIAVFVGVAVSALSSLQPSALHQAGVVSSAVLAVAPVEDEGAVDVGKD